MKENTIFSELYDFIEGTSVINTHSHHLRGEEFAEYSLDKLLEKSYVSWCGVTFDKTKESRLHFLQKVRNRSYFVWLQDALHKLHDFDEPISTDNWEKVSQRIQTAHQDSDYHLQILRTVCKYQRIVLDGYWDPGTDNGIPDLFSPTFRINMFLYGYSHSSMDHNGNNPLVLYNRRVRDLEEYISLMREIITMKVNGGCIALKSALAYDRSLDFTPTSKERARKVFTKGDDERSAEDIRAFQDFIFYEICTIAGELRIPFQCHTGLGELDRTNAMWLREAIVRNPDTRFVLFHGGYPWTDDVAGLIHRYENVYADICWLPIISPSAAARMLHELIEVGTADRVTWGCDTWSSEESYGAMRALRHVLAKVFAEKITDGYLSLGDAREMIERILHRNAADLYGVS